MDRASIDLNCDLGEGFGVYRAGRDEDLLSFVSSANIACGFHAGDPMIMKRTVGLCLANGVAIGAHPGLADLAGFGRREIPCSAEEAYALTTYQIGALLAFVRAEGGRLHHVKPHGALYHMASRDRNLAEAIAEAVYRLVPEAVLYGLPGSELLKAGERLGLRCAKEAFADRTYTPDGGLVPRSHPQAVLPNEEAVLEQAVRLAKGESIASLTGAGIVVKADTLCLHGDHPNAADHARRLRRRLEREGIAVRPV
jgi:UPF0271 protein